MNQWEINVGGAMEKGSDHNEAIFKGKRGFIKEQ